jgi:hypothetical protein
MIEAVSPTNDVRRAVEAVDLLLPTDLAESRDEVAVNRLREVTRMSGMDTYWQGYKETKSFLQILRSRGVL